MWSFLSLIVGWPVIMGLKLKIFFLFSWFHFLRIHLLIYCSLKRNPCSLLHHTSVEIDWCWMWFNLGPFYVCKVITYLNVVISLIGMVHVDWCWSCYWFVLWLAWHRLFVNRILLTYTFGLSIIICKNYVNQILLIYVFGFCIIICKNGMLIDWFPGHWRVWVDAIHVEPRLSPPFLIKNWSLKWGKKLSTWHISTIGGKKKPLKIVYFYYYTWVG